MLNTHLSSSNMLNTRSELSEVQMKLIVFKIICFFELPTARGRIFTSVLAVQPILLKTPNIIELNFSGFLTFLVQFLFI